MIPRHDLNAVLDVNPDEAGLIEEQIGASGDPPEELVELVKTAISPLATVNKVSFWLTVRHNGCSYVAVIEGFPPRSKNPSTWNIYIKVKE